MKNRLIIAVSIVIGLLFLSSFSFKTLHFQKPSLLGLIQKDSVKQDSTDIDSIAIVGKFKFTLLKKKGHASYYHDKFNGRSTASGEPFDNNKYTAAHKKLPFGTKVRVTNHANGKSVIVKINDRGPFVKGRDIDLSKRAFRDIARSIGYGQMTVTLELVEELEQIDE